jgi:GntR family transcriptional regulator, transcriptional repressor for pyruvate dehydrogenase complex
VAQAGQKNPTSLRHIRQPASLVAEIARRIAADIASGRLAAGARLPTEQAMMQMTGVSRTVVREAVAALRAEGLVTTRQGVGAFVVDAPLLPPFRIEAGQKSSLADAVHIMELRAAVETEAAGLAAERARPAQLRAIRSALAAIDAAIGRGEDAVAEDFAFHAAIAEATGNPQFRRFLEFIGGFVIPRAKVRIRAANLPAYLMTFQLEHRAIFTAIEARSPEQAQAAMRTHLVRSRERYRSLSKS